MTSLIAWTGVDARGPASIYLASDSRISWGNNSTWDYGRKLFASRKYPEILGYAGDALFPSQVLGQLVDLIDRGVLFTEKDTPDTKWSKIVAAVQRSFQGYPGDKSSPYSILYCTRDKSGTDSIFRLTKLKWEKIGWQDEGWLNLPEESGLITVLGSGKETIAEWELAWRKSSQGGTSRSIFSAFCDALQGAKDPHSGGAPQLVGLWRIEAARLFGIIYKDQRYLFGLPMGASDSLDAVEWRNALFERCDWQTMKVMNSAQRHSRPRDLSKT